jgi:hypothetical protein
LHDISEFQPFRLRILVKTGNAGYKAAS